MTEHHHSDNDDIEIQETTPLLTSSHSDNDNDNENHHDHPFLKQKYFFMLILSCIFLAFEFAIMLSAAPQTAIYEGIICHNRFPDINPSVSDDLCKSEEVQSELAIVSGWQETSNLLPALLLSFPYGAVADKVGRKSVLLMGTFGIMLGELWVRVVCWYANVIPLRLVWLSGLWRIIGGGERVFLSTALVVVADLYSEEERTTAIVRLAGIATIAEILAIPTSAYLMKFDPWIPYSLAWGLMVCGVIIGFLLPETLRHPDTGSAEIEEPDSDSSTDAKGSFIEKTLAQIQMVFDSTRVLWKNQSIMLCLFPLFVAVITYQSSGIFIQYASKRLHWNIAKASLLMSLRGCMTLITFYILTPLASHLLSTYFHLSPAWKDLRLSQGTALISAIGYLFVAAASSPPALIFGNTLLSLGAGTLVTVRGLATTLVSSDHFGTLYAAIGIAEAVGGLVTGPMLAYGLRAGMRMGEEWMGVPFLEAAVLFLLAFVSISWVKLPRRGVV